MKKLLVCSSAPTCYNHTKQKPSQDSTWQETKKKKLVDKWKTKKNQKRERRSANCSTELLADFLFSIYKKFKGNRKQAESRLGPVHLAKLCKVFLTAEEVQLSLSYVQKKTYVHKKKPTKKGGKKNGKNKWGCVHVWSLKMLEVRPRKAEPIVPVQWRFQGSPPIPQGSLWIFRVRHRTSGFTLYFSGFALNF